MVLERQSSIYKARSMLNLMHINDIESQATTNCKLENYTVLFHSSLKRLNGKGHLFLIFHFFFEPQPNFRSFLGGTKKNEVSVPKIW